LSHFISHGQLTGKLRNGAHVNGIETEDIENMKHSNPKGF